MPACIAPAGYSASTPLVCDPISTVEKWGAALLIATTFAVGIYPKPLFDRIMPAVEAMHFLTNR